MLSKQELKELSLIKEENALLATLGDWLLISFCFVASAIYPHPITFLIAAIIIARTQLALALLMHDASHFRLLKNKKYNDYFAQFFCSGPIFFSLYSYRSNHLRHHKKPLALDDPDITLIGGYPISKSSFLRKLLRDLFGISYFKFIHYFLYGSHKRKINISGKGNIATHSDKAYFSKPMIIFSILLSNLLILMTLFYFDQHYLYLILWLLPSMTILQLLLRIRGIAEHAGLQINEDQSQNARTILNPWQTFFFAPHNVNYHIEHHLYVGIPFYNLPKAHQLLHARGALPKKNLYRNYNEILKELVI